MISGLFAVAFGAWCVYRAAGYIVGGAALVYLGIVVDQEGEQGDAAGEERAGTRRDPRA